MHIISQDKLLIVNSDNISSYEIYMPDDQFFIADSRAEKAMKDGKYLLVADRQHLLGIYGTCKQASDVCCDLLRAIENGMASFNME